MMKMPRIIIGLVLCVAALFIYVACGITLYKALDARALAETQAKRIDDNCQSNLKAFGRVYHKINKIIDVDLGEVRDPRSTLSDMASIMAYCPFDKLVEACIGTGCSAVPSAIPRANLRLEVQN